MLRAPVPRPETRTARCGSWGTSSLRRYGGGRERGLSIPALGLLGPEGGQALPGSTLVDSGFTLRSTEETLTFLRQLDEKHHRVREFAPWEDALREGVRAVLAALGCRAVSRLGARGARVMGYPATDEAPRRPGRIRDLFAGSPGGTGLTGEAETAARAVAGDGRPVVTAGSGASGAALGALSRGRGRVGLRGHNAAFATLWRHATDFLFARSDEPPEEPRDWAIAADIACTLRALPEAQGILPRPRRERGAFSVASRISAAICTRSSIGTGSTSTTLPNAAAVPISSSAPRTGRPTSGASRNTPRTSRRCGR